MSEELRRVLTDMLAEADREVARLTALSEYRQFELKTKQEAVEAIKATIAIVEREAAKEPKP